jgi:hypothetical protein
MARPEFRMSFPDVDALAHEFEFNLKHGRGFVPDATVAEVLSDCTLVLLHPVSGGTLSLSARTVMVVDSGGMRGVGLQLLPFDTALRDRVERFVAGDAAAVDPAPPAEAAPRDAPVTSNVPASSADEDANDGRGLDEVAEDATDDEDGAEAETDASVENAGGEEDGAPGGGAAGGEDDAEPDPLEQRADVHTQHRIDVLRKLSHAQRQKVARKGELQDRVLLERLFGRDLWPQLLQNPKLTLPEVARIGRKRSVPLPLLQVIVDNNTWIQASVVRRALLSNPRVGHDAVDKLIRMTPKHELKLMTSTLAYSGYVRDAARRALKKE